jgi:CRP-like cAMP-binding protein
MELLPLLLTVTRTGECPVLRNGDQIIFNGREVQAARGRLCAPGLCVLYPKLVQLLQGAGGTESSGEVTCGQEGCEAAFLVEPYMPAEKRVSQTVVTSRRMEYAARVATEQLRSKGPFMSRLPEEAAKRLQESAEAAKFDQGAVILAEGQTGEALYIVQNGEVEVSRASQKDGAEVMLTVLGKGECFGEMSMLTGNPTSANIRARGEATVLIIGREKFESLLNEIPLLHRAFSQVLANRIGAMNISRDSELGRGLLGTLTMISIVDLVQTLSASRRTGQLVLTRANEKCILQFKDGNVASARLGMRKGEEAFYEVVTWSDGDFCFENTEPSPDFTARIRRDTMSLLMEAMRRVDELRR